MPRSLSPMPAVAAAFALCMTGAAHAADDPVVLAPASQWQLDLGEDNCRISRLFGDTEKPHLFFLEQWSPSSNADWRVSGPELDRYRLPGEIRFSFGPEGDDGSYEALKSTLGDFGTVVGSGSTVAKNNHPPIPELAKLREKSKGEAQRGQAPDEGPMTAAKLSLDAEQAAGVSSLTVGQNGRTDVMLQLGSMKAPLDAMNQCMDNLVKYWGLDVDEQKSVARTARFDNLSEIAREIQKSYPSKALVRGAQANFAFRVIISEDGKIEQCKLLATTLAEEFQFRKDACDAVVKIGEASPAIAVSGKPVRSYIFTRINYRIPK